MTLQEALLQGTRLLEEGRIASPRLTAEVLLCHALRQERPFLYAHYERELREVEWIHYGRYLHERLKGKPTQYITGRQEFYGREFRVTPDVLIPRPETELVVETALNVARGARRMVDVGCGSGAIAITLRLETQALVYGTDISAAALAVAADNALRLGAPVEFARCDLVSAMADASVDLIACNPPYVPLGDRTGLQREVREHEPEVALFAGPSGFEIYDRLVVDAARVLRPGGWIVMELGYNSRDRVVGMLGRGWRDVRVELDLAGIPRVLAAKWDR
ncbi:MAG TPA: peptide chain release factor N(5)-glutamine methyltransferase [Bryobacteraceae bacterium]|nr:peptide chain release factor N(5)-glutamine methyltransferase [Bryobacteraceae bacterium]